MPNPVAALLSVLLDALYSLLPASPGRHRVGAVIAPYRPRRTVTVEPVTMVIPAPMRSLRIPPYITVRELAAVR